MAQSNPYALEPEVHDLVGHAGAEENLVGFDGVEAFEATGFPPGTPEDSVVGSSAVTSTPAFFSESKTNAFSDSGNPA